MLRKRMDCACLSRMIFEPAYSIIIANSIGFHYIVLYLFMNKICAQHEIIFD